MVLKYKVGDQLMVRSRKWYNSCKDMSGCVRLIGYTESEFDFIEDMAQYCGTVVTVSNVYRDFFSIKEDNERWYWTDEMIEGLVEEETKPKFKVGDIIELKKSHPCQNKLFRILRVGSDMRIVCLKCEHDMVIDRIKLEKATKKIVS